MYTDISNALEINEKPTTNVPQMSEFFNRISMRSAPELPDSHEPQMIHVITSIDSRKDVVSHITEDWEFVMSEDSIQQEQSTPVSPRALTTRLLELEEAYKDLNKRLCENQEKTDEDKQKGGCISPETLEIESFTNVCNK